MISVQLLYRRPDGVTTGGVLITEGIVNVFSVRRYDTTSGEMTTVAFSANIGSTVQLDPGTWGFELENIPDGRGGILSGSDALQYRVVPATGGPFQIDDLEETTGPGVSSTPTPEWAAALAALQAQVNSIVITGGGIPAPVNSVFTDATTFGKARLKDADAAAARTALGPVPLADNSTLTGTTSIVNLAVSGTTSFVDGSIAQAEVSGLVTALAGLAPKDNPIFTGTVTVPDGSLAIADVSGLQAALDGVTIAGGVSAAYDPVDTDIVILTWT